MSGRVVGAVVALCVVSCSPSGTGSPGEVELGSAATSGGASVSGAEAGELEAFVARHAREGTTAEGAVKLWIEAALRYSADGGAHRATAISELSYLSIPLKDDPDWLGRPTNGIFVDRLGNEPHLFRSYAVGATPENGYAMDPTSWTLNVDRVEEPIDDRGTRVFLVSGGADSPRPVYCKQSEQSGLWYVNVFANTYVGIRPIVDPTKETFR